MGVVPFMLIGAVVVQLRDAPGIELDEALAVVHETARSIDDAGHGPARVADVDWTSCRSDAPCLERHFTAHPGSTLVLMRLIAGVRRTRVIAERYEASGLVATSTLSASTLTKERAALSRTMTLDLFGPPRARAAEPTLGVTTAGAEIPTLTWIGGALGAAALATGVTLGVRVRSADRRLEDNVLSRASHDALLSRRRTEAVAANVALATAGVAIGGALLWWWSSDGAIDVPAERDGRARDLE